MNRLLRGMLTLAVIASFAVVAGGTAELLAANGKGPGDGTGIGVCKCGARIDIGPADGICDECGGCIPKQDGPKGPRKGVRPQCNGNGPGNGTGTGPCQCETPMDTSPADGICDTCGKCVPKKEGPKGKGKRGK